ncbi:MAG: HAD hydrolase-like protein, partial [Pyrobaculum sp.]
PDPLYVVGRHFSVDVRDVVVVGDSDYDMEMAERAGAVGICIARRSFCNKAKKIITSLRQLLDLVVT